MVNEVLWLHPQILEATDTADEDGNSTYKIGVFPHFPLQPMLAQIPTFSRMPQGFVTCPPDGLKPIVPLVLRNEWHLGYDTAATSSRGFKLRV